MNIHLISDKSFNRAAFSLRRSCQIGIKIVYQILVTNTCNTVGEIAVELHKVLLVEDMFIYRIIRTLAASQSKFEMVFMVTRR